MKASESLKIQDTTPIIRYHISGHLQALHTVAEHIRQGAILGLILFVLITACSAPPQTPGPTPPTETPHTLPRLGYAIQAGAFADINNAVRFTRSLQTKGLDAYHFISDAGLYKVRFGNFASKNSARQRAVYLKTRGIIDVYYIVQPEDYAVARYRDADNSRLRNELVKTAERYLGVPYRWGGESPASGFDCSGLTMVVYQLNGLKLPRTSAQQWQAGAPVRRSRLLKGDLVFFATSGGRKVSHVGIYTGDGKFLHAPRRGRNIQIASLSNSYYQSRYLGARSYMQ